MRLIVNMPEEDRAMDIGNRHKNLVKIANVVPEISSRTERQTDTRRQTDIHITILHNTNCRLPEREISTYLYLDIIKDNST